MPLKHKSSYKTLVPFWLTSESKRYLCCQGWAGDGLPAGLDEDSHLPIAQLKSGDEQSTYVVFSKDPEAFPTGVG